MKSIGNYLLLLGLSVSRAYAETSEVGGLKDPLAGKGFQTILDGIIAGLLKIAIPIVAIMVIIGGFMIMTAGGNSEKVSSGKNVILYAIIGYAVILFSQVAVDLLKSVLGA